MHERTESSFPQVPATYNLNRGMQENFHNGKWPLWYLLIQRETGGWEREGRKDKEKGKRGLKLSRENRDT